MTGFEELEIAIKLSREKSIGAAKFKQLIDDYKYPSIAFQVWEKQKGEKKDKRPLEKKKNSTTKLISESIACLKAKKFYASYYGQDNYPKGLKLLSEPPPIIFMSSPIKEIPLAAVVGARKASKERLNIAKEICLNLIKEGYGIISGGALGIDEVAHETAISEGVYTLAVLATGLDVIYPKCHKELLKKIKSNGALLTELMVGAPAIRSFFPTRNRIIAALAEKVIALPSSDKSGSLITAKWAKKLNKPLICL